MRDVFMDMILEVEPLTTSHTPARGGRELPCTCLGRATGGRGWSQPAAPTSLRSGAPPQRALHDNFSPPPRGRLPPSSNRLEIHAAPPPPPPPWASPLASPPRPGT